MTGEIIFMEYLVKKREWLIVIDMPIMEPV